MNHEGRAVWCAEYVFMCIVIMSLEVYDMLGGIG